MKIKKIAQYMMRCSLPLMMPILIFVLFFASLDINMILPVTIYQVKSLNDNGALRDKG